MEPDSGPDFVVVELGDHQARKLGAILGGAFFKPAVVEEVEAVFEDLVIEWVALAPTSPGVDRSIAALAIRRTTGVSVIAIIRGAQAITAPEPSEILRVGDRLGCRQPAPGPGSVP